MKKKMIFLTLLIPIITSTMIVINPSSAETTKNSVSMEEIAKYYAPIWYQDVDDTDTDADYITNFNFDQNWNGSDNWENQANTTYHPLKPYIYYSVVETVDHWYIGYYDFHPRDWSDFFLDPQHENDMEGCLAIILKNGSTYGEAQALITEAHNSLWQYRYPTEAGNKLTNDQADIDDTCHITDNGANGYRAHVFVQAKGHGVYAGPNLVWMIDWWDDLGFPGGDGVIYNYNPNNISTTIIGSTANYSLVDVSSIYDRVDNGDMYYHDDDDYYDDPFRGDTHDDNAAKAPWVWAGDDGSEQGWIFWEPWKTADAFFNNETFSDQLLQTNYDNRGIYPELPAQVTGLAVTTKSETELDLEWNQNTEVDLDHYNVYRSTESGFITNTTTKIDETSNNYYNDTGLTSLTTYYYKVSAVDTSDNEGTPSSEASGITDTTLSELPWTPITIAITLITITIVITLNLKKQKQ